MLQNGSLVISLCIDFFTYLFPLLSLKYKKSTGNLKQLRENKENCKQYYVSEYFFNTNKLYVKNSCGAFQNRYNEGNKKCIMHLYLNDSIAFCLQQKVKKE